MRIVSHAERSPHVKLAVVTGLVMAASYVVSYFVFGVLYRAIDLIQGIAQ